MKQLSRNNKPLLWNKKHPTSSNSRWRCPWSFKLEKGENKITMQLWMLTSRSCAQVRSSEAAINTWPGSSEMKENRKWCIKRLLSFFSEGRLLKNEDANKCCGEKNEKNTLKVCFIITNCLCAHQYLVSRPFPIMLGNVLGFEQLFENRATSGNFVCTSNFWATFELLLPFELGAGPHRDTS